MRNILMSNVTFSMEHVNGHASVNVPVWYVMLYGMTSLVWPAVAIWALAR